MARIKHNLGRCVAIGALLVAVSGLEANGAPKSQEPEIAARVGDKIITVQEVDAEFLSANMKLAQQMYDARLKALEQLIMKQALSDEAASMNISVDALINQKLAARSTPVSDADIQAYYDKNKARMQGKTLETLSGQIRSYLASQQKIKARRTLIAQVKSSANVKIMLEAPRANVAIAANDPYKGPADAKVTIVEFSDFQ